LTITKHVLNATDYGDMPLKQLATSVTNYVTKYNYENRKRKTREWREFHCSDGVRLKVEID